MNLSLRGRIMLCYAILIIVSISISLGIFFYSRNNVTNEAVKDIAYESIVAESRAFDVVLTNIMDTSKIIIASQLVQNALAHYMWESDQKAMSYVKETISFSSNISSAYLFRTDGIKYYLEKKSFKNFTYRDIVNSKIYPTIQSRKGGYVVSLNGAGLISGSTKYVSFFRNVNSLKDFKPLGILCVNLEFEKVFNPNAEHVQLIDKGELYVVRDNEDGSVSEQTILNLFEESDSFSTIIRSKKGDIVVVGTKNKGLNMNFVRCIPVYAISLPISSYTVIIAITIVINGLLIFFGSIWISEYISKPIKNLTKSMEGVYKGNFNFVTTVKTKDEIGRLQDVYNITIDKIQKLINDIIEDQKALRKAELEITINQIKPHFLYNTLNSIKSLAVMGKINEVSETIKALSDFYRVSLNNGQEIITLDKELQCIASYQYIQQLRYMDLFRIEYEIEPEALNINVPKMILQPLVENSIYHGIRGSVTDGLIIIKASVDQDYLYIEVMDNGKGITEERLPEVLKGKNVGLGSTMKRIAIMCGDTSEFKIESKSGIGTTVSIKINRGL